MTKRLAERLLAAVIAGTASVGLGLDWSASAARSGSGLVALWSMLRFFTITTNGLVALSFCAIAAGFVIGARALAGLTLSIVLVGVVFRLLLEGLFHHLGAGTLLLHRGTPILVPLFWVLFVPKGRLRLRDPFLWFLYPCGYFGYVMLRGAIENRYPYPFLDVGEIGWHRTIVNALVIGASFVVTGLFTVWLDRGLGTRTLSRQHGGETA